MKTDRKTLAIISRRLAAALLVFAVLAAFSTVVSFAETSGSFTYSVVEPEKDEDFEPYNVISRYSRDDTETELAVDIPDIIDKIPTEVIAASAFKGNDVIEEFVIPDTVKVIENSAFADCTALKVVIIPDSVTEIGYSAFQGCTALEYVVIGSGVKVIGSLAFKDCPALRHLRIGDSVENIESGAFYNCENLKDIVVPASVKEIGSMALGYYDEGDTRQAVDGVKLYARAQNEALDRYVFESLASSQSGVALPYPEIVAECAEGSHDAQFALVRAANDDHTGVELAQCAVCFDVLSRPNDELPPEEQSASGIASLIIGIIAALAFICLCAVYVRRSKARRAKAIEEYKKQTAEAGPGDENASAGQ